MHRSSSVHRHCIILALALAGLGACGRTPLDSSATQAAAAGPLVGGRIGVTLYNGALANGAGFVDLLQPDGSKLSLNAAPNCTFTALTQSGPYRVQFRDQAAALPAFQQISLSPVSPHAAVSLQIGGAALQVSPAPYQGSSYAFAAASFLYTVQVTQAPSDAQDYLLDVDPASLPAGWTASFGQTVARGPLSTTLLVTTAEATTPTALALKVRARAGAVELDQVIALQKAWSLSLSTLSSAQFLSWDSVKGVYNCLATYSLRVNASGLPPGQPVYLHCNSCPNGLNGQADGLFAPVNVTLTVGASGTVAGCYPNVVGVCLDAYCTPAQTL